jgi:hypothetical protein
MSRIAQIILGMAIWAVAAFILISILAGLAKAVKFVWHLIPAGAGWWVAIAVVVVVVVANREEKP